MEKKNRNTSRELMVVNSAPDVDVIGISVANYRIIVEREEDGTVTVAILDDQEGSEMLCVLGQEGYTQKV